MLRPEGNAFAKPVTTKARVHVEVGAGDGRRQPLGRLGLRHRQGSTPTPSPSPSSLSVGNAEPGNPAFAALQQPGPDAASVLIQDETQATQVSLTGDSPTTGGVKASQGAPGQRLFLSAPVRLASLHPRSVGRGVQRLLRPQLRRPHRRRHGRPRRDEEGRAHRRRQGASTADSSSSTTSTPVTCGTSTATASRSTTGTPSSRRRRPTTRTRRRTRTSSTTR